MELCLQTKICLYIALVVCRLKTYPVSFMTEVSPQSQAPPAWLKNMLKSWRWWFPFLKHSVHRDMQGEMPQVRHLYATKFGVQTSPHVVALSYFRTAKKISKNQETIIKVKDQISWINKFGRQKLRDPDVRISAAKLRLQNPSLFHLDRTFGKSSRTVILVWDVHRCAYLCLYLSLTSFLRDHH